MPGLDKKLVEHRLPIKLDFKPFQQPSRRMTYEVIHQVKTATERLLKTNFIKNVRYVEWLCNIVLLVKNNEKIRVYIDYRKFNVASPKDKYPILVVDLWLKYKLLSRTLYFFPL